MVNNSWDVEVPPVWCYECGEHRLQWSSEQNLYSQREIYITCTDCRSTRREYGLVKTGAYYTPA